MNRKLCQTETEAREFAQQKHYPGWEQIAMIFKMGNGKWYVQIVEAHGYVELVDVYHNGKVLGQDEPCKCGAD